MRGRAKAVKRNLQLANTSETYKSLEKKITDLLINDRSIASALICPKTIFNILFSRTSVGMRYGSHVDAAHSPLGRRDYSFTLFLNDPSEYEDGNLFLIYLQSRNQ